MNGWLWFWIIAIIISYLIFFGVAIVVGVKGWADLKYLLTHLKNNQKTKDQ